MDLRIHQHSRRVTHTTVNIRAVAVIVSTTTTMYTFNSLERPMASYNLGTVFEIFLLCSMSPQRRTNCAQTNNHAPVYLHGIFMYTSMAMCIQKRALLFANKWSKISME